MSRLLSWACLSAAAGLFAWLCGWPPLAAAFYAPLAGGAFLWLFQATLRLRELRSLP